MPLLFETEQYVLGLKSDEIARKSMAATLNEIIELYSHGEITNGTVIPADGLIAELKKWEEENA